MTPSDLKKLIEAANRSKVVAPTHELRDALQALAPLLLELWEAAELNSKERVALVYKAGSWGKSPSEIEIDAAIEKLREVRSGN